MFHIFYFCLWESYFLIISLLAKINTFDFADFKIGGGGFAIIFLAEYARILFIRIIWVEVRWGCSNVSNFKFASIHYFFEYKIEKFNIFFLFSKYIYIEYLE